MLDQTEQGLGKILYTLKSEVYIFDSDLVWRMQLMIKNSCCVRRELLTFNA